VSGIVSAGQGMSLDLYGVQRQTSGRLTHGFGPSEGDECSIAADGCIGNADESKGILMEDQAKLSRRLGGWPLVHFTAAAVVMALFLGFSTGAMAQTSDVSASKVAAVIPQQVRYVGAFANRAGDTVEATFRIYATAEGGEALWTETQQVAVKADGSYSVLLGAASQSGLPQSVFAAGQARWLGVSIDSAESLPRTALSSVAYAMKAGDAETVGGVAAANLVTKDELAKMSQASTMAVQAQGSAQTAVQAGVQPAANPTGSGTADYVALWTTSGNLGNSGLYQAASGFFGIGTTTPGGPLQLATGATGGANATMMLTQTSAASGNYYADIGLYNSKGLIGNLSALGAGYPSGNLFVANDVVFLGGQQNAGTNLIFLTNTSGALKFGTGGYAVSNERMRIGAAGGVSVGNSYVGTDPGAGNLIVSGKVGVGTTAPAAVLEVNGTAKFDGLVSFEMGQTFPGAGTITDITTSSPLTGGGTSGTVALGLSTSALETTLNGVYAQLGAADTFADAATFSQGITASQAQGGVSAAVIGNGSNGSTGVYGLSDTSVGVTGESNSGTGVYGSSGTGHAGYFTGNSQNLVYVTNSANIAGGAISSSPVAVYAVGTGTDSTGVYGSGTGSGVQGYASASTGGTGVTGEANDGSGGEFVNDGTDSATVYAVNLAAGSSTAGPSVFQAEASGINGYGVYSVMSGNGAVGLYGESDGTTESGSGRSGIGVKGLGKGADSNGLTGDATGTGGYGLYAHASGGPDTDRYASAGVYALSNTGTGVEGFAGGQSALFNSVQTAISGHPFLAGIWGDTSESGTDTDVIAGVVGTADNDYAAFFENNSSSLATIDVVNQNKGGTGLFKVFKASTAAGTCGIGDGDLSCTGQLKTLATTGGGARTVETYATQSAENWMEDYGTGAMEGGVGVVQIEPSFAGTVAADANYHVFLTPRGDSKGLYVTHATATSFEVHESGGGTSSISFDYKIVAKRRGYEAERLVDVTDRFNAEQAETKRRMPTVTAVASKGVVEPEMAQHPASLARATALRARARAAGSVAPQVPVVPKNSGTQTKAVAKPVVQK
jgi:hypothetical protein